MCFIKPESVPFFTLFLAPIVLVLLVNMVIFILVAKVICETKSVGNISDREQTLVSKIPKNACLHYFSTSKRVTLWSHPNWPYDLTAKPRHTTKHWEQLKVGQFGVDGKLRLEPLDIGITWIPIVQIMFPFGNCDPQRSYRLVFVVIRQWRALLCLRFHYLPTIIFVSGSF